MEAIYSAEDGVIHIRDEELDLDLQEPFDATRCWPSLEASSAYSLEEISFPDGKMIERFLRKGGKRSGQCITYKKGTEELVSLSYYRDDLLHGPSHHYGAQGQLLALSYFVEGKKQGRAYQYYKNGALYCETRFKDHQPHGLQRYFFPSRAIKAQIPYKEGKLHGEIAQYFQNGQLFRRFYFEEHQRHGLEEQFNPNGDPVFMCHYHHDAPTGVSRVWHPGAILAEHYCYHDRPWRYDVDKYDEEGHQWFEGRYKSDSHYEEKIFSKSGRCTGHKIYARKDDQWVVAKVLIDDMLEGV